MSSKYATGGIVQLPLPLTGGQATEYVSVAFVGKVDIEALKAQAKVLGNGMVTMNGAVYSPAGELLIRFIHRTHTALIAHYERLGYVPLRADELTPK